MERELLRASAPEVIRALQEAAQAASRSEPSRSSAAAAVLSRHPFDLVSVAASLMIARSLPERPTALLLGVQAETAPAAANLSRTAGQLFLLAGEQFWRGAAADAPLAALQAMSREAGPAPVVAGAVWALALLARLPGPR